MKTEFEDKGTGEELAQKPDIYSAYGLDQGIEEILGDVSISLNLQDMHESKIRRLIRRAVMKVFRPVLGPAFQRMTETNYNAKRALIAMASVIRDQQGQLDELYEAVRDRGEQK